MTDSDDPSRLLDSPETRAGLRDVLQAAKADVGTDAQVARLGARLGPLLGPAVLAPAAGLGTAATASGAAKLGLAALALMIAGGGAWLYSAPGSPPQSATPPAPISARTAPTPPSQVVPPAAEAPAAAAPASPASVEPAEEAKPATKPAPVAQVSEAELLEQARGALRSDPARALARANEHRTRFPRGVLVQEREVIAITALRQLGRSAEADRRTEAFSKAFPGSAFQRKLNASP